MDIGSGSIYGREIQGQFHRQLETNIGTGNVIQVKATLCDLVTETLSEPRSGTLAVLPETVELVVSGYSSQPQIVKNLASMSVKDYTTTIHSINVMALTLGFCFY